MSFSCCRPSSMCYHCNSHTGSHLEAGSRPSMRRGFELRKESCRRIWLAYCIVLLLLLGISSSFDLCNLAVVGRKIFMWCIEFASPRPSVSPSCSSILYLQGIKVALWQIACHFGGCADSIVSRPRPLWSSPPCKSTSFSAQLAFGLALGSLFEDIVLWESWAAWHRGYCRWI